MTKVASPKPSLLPSFDAEIDLYFEFDFFENLTGTRFVNVWLWFTVGQEAKGSLVGT